MILEQPDYIFIGTSLETKPANALPGQRALETDTGDAYIWIGNRSSGTWQQYLKEGGLITGGGKYGLRARMTLNNMGSVPLLDGTNGDVVELIVQDNFTTLTSWTAKAQGIFFGVSL